MHTSTDDTTENTIKNTIAPPSVHNTLILSDSPEVARRLLEDLEGAANRSKAARTKPAFIYESKRGIVLIDPTQHSPSQISYEHELSPEYLRMMDRVIVLVAREQCKARGGARGGARGVDVLSKAQRSTLSGLSGLSGPSKSSADDIEIVLCLEGEAEDEAIRGIKKRVHDELLSSLGRAHSSVVRWRSSKQHHSALYRRLRSSLETRTDAETSDAETSETVEQTVELGRLSITHIFQGYRKYRHLTDSSGGLFIRAFVREGSVKEGDQIEIVGARCRVRSEVKRIERWREHIPEAGSGEIVTLILSDVLFTEVELGDELYVISSAEQRDTMQERLKDRLAHRGWSEEERHDYESAVEMGVSLRQLLRSNDAELHQQCLELISSLELELSEMEVIAFRETLGGLIIRNSKRGYFTPTLVRFISGGESTLITSLRRSLTRLMFREVDYERISSQYLYSYLTLAYEGEGRECALHIINCKFERHYDELCAQLISKDQPIGLAFHQFDQADLYLLRDLLARPLRIERLVVKSSEMSYLESGLKLIMKQLGHTPNLAELTLNVEGNQSTCIDPSSSASDRGQVTVAQLVMMIEIESDLAQPRHVMLTQMMNELSVTGYPSLINLASEVLRGDQGRAKTWMSAPLRSALARVCSRVEGSPPEIERRFDEPEEEHLLDQLGALMTDLEQLLMWSDEDELSQLRKRLWIGATRHLLERARRERDQRLYSILSSASDELENLLLLSADRFEREACDLLAESLRLCHMGGGALSLILPGESDETQITQLKESGLALDLRGVERLTIEGYGVLNWLNGVERGLDEVRSIKALMLSDADVVGLKSRGLFERVEMGWSKPVVIYQLAPRVNLRMVRCPAGEFWMGYGRDRRVEITQPFLVGRTQVTRTQWSSIMGGRERGDRPQEVNWFESIRFCNALSEQAGLEPVYDIGSGHRPTVSLHLDRTGYRLPTEAEWEYMARAGTELTYAGSNDVDEVAWTYNNSGRQVQPVAQKKPNAWGIYDCSGNVQEWCNDQWRNLKTVRAKLRDPYQWSDLDTPRAYRGGRSRYGDPPYSVKNRDREDTRYSCGFRVVRSLFDHS